MFQSRGDSKASYGLLLKIQSAIKNAASDKFRVFFSNLHAENNQLRCIIVQNMNPLSDIAAVLAKCFHKKLFFMSNRIDNKQINF